MPPLIPAGCVLGMTLRSQFPAWGQRPRVPPQGLWVLGWFPPRTSITLSVPALTGVELEALLAEGVAAAPQFAVLLQHQHPPAGLGQQHGRRQAPDAAADDDGIQPRGDFVCRENCGSGVLSRGSRNGHGGVMPQGWGT